MSAAMAPVDDAVTASLIINCDENGMRSVIEVAEKTQSEVFSDDGTEPAMKFVSRNVWIHSASNTCSSWSMSEDSLGL